MKKYDLKVLIPSALSVILAALLISTLFYKSQQHEAISSTPSPPQSFVVGTTDPQQSPQTVNFNLQKVTRVVDGDTIELENGQKVRYIGINTPETVDPRKPVECFGKEASQKNKELVEGKNVRLEKDVSETDTYQRLLRYVYVGNIFVNDYLVRQGFAYTSSYPPDVKYQNQFQDAQQEAQTQSRGLWSSCTPGSTPTVQPQNQQDSTCQIKGNISSSGEKIYHVPGQRYYDKTVIDESKGERWFCTEDDAVKAGWRKSKV